MISFLFVIVILLQIIIYRRKKSRIYEFAKKIKTNLVEYPIIGHGYLFCGSDEERMKGFQELGREALTKNGIVAAWLAHRLYTIVADPEIAEVVLRNCPEKDYTMYFLQTVLGYGTIVAPVSVWRSRRKITAMCFSHKNLASFMDNFYRHSEVMKDRLMSTTETNISIFKYMGCCAMDIIYESVYGEKIQAQKNFNHEIVKSWDEVRDIVTSRMCRPWLHYNLIFKMMPSYSKLLKQKKLLADFADKAIKTKLGEQQNQRLQKTAESEQIANHKTFMEILMETSKKEGGYSTLELQEETMVLAFAGSDSSTVGASFTALILAKYPEVQEKVYRELHQIFDDSTRQVTAEDLSRMKYLEAVIKETLRLYPPVPVIVRNVLQNLILPSGSTLPNGTGSLINIWAIHRNPRYWGSDADVFKPERFLDLTVQHPAQFMPFSFGPRNCLGPQLAMMLIKTMISTIVRNFKLLPPSPRTEEFNANNEFYIKFDLTMKAVNNYSMRLETRK